MEWACCYVVVEDRSVAEVAGWARASNGWALLIDPGFAFGDADARLREWARHGRVARLLVVERELFSHASLWAGGELAWEVSYESELDERPSTGGRFPYDLDDLAAAVGPPDDPRTWFRVPAEALRRAISVSFTA